MTSLNKYQRQNSFISGVNGSLLDGELDRVGLSLGSLVNALLTIRRDDGELKDGIVKAHALHPEAFQKFVDENKAACEPLINQAKAYVDQAASHAERASHYADMVSTSVDDARDEADHARQYATDAGKIAKEVECAKGAAHIYEQGTYSWYLKTKFEADAAQRAIKKVKQLAEHVEYETEKAEAAADSAEARAKAACECRRKAEEAATSISQANNKAAEHLQAIERLAVEIAELRTQIDEKAEEIGNNHNQVIVIQNNLSQLQQQLETKVSEALTVLEQATKLVYGAGFSVTPAPNKVPIARDDGTIDALWIPEYERAIRELFLNVFQFYKEIDALDESTKQLIEQAKGDILNQLQQFESRLNQSIQQLENDFGVIKADRELSAITDAAQFEAEAEVRRSYFQSGLMVSRQYSSGGPNPWDRPFDVGYATAGIHSHWDIASTDGGLVVGMAEWNWLVNGYYGRTRHNDYHTLQTASGDFLAREPIELPAVPSDVANLPAEQQSPKMRAYFEALTGKRDPSSLADYESAFTWALTGLEVWFEEYAETLTDAYAGLRHVIDANNMTDLLQKIMYFGATGHKNRRENIAFLNPLVRFKGSDGRPRYAVLKHRVICNPVGNLVEFPLSTVKPVYDAANLMRFKRSFKQNINSRQQRFEIPDVVNAPSALDEMIYRIWGLDGRDTSSTEEYTQYGLKDSLTDWSGQPLNASKYSRFYRISYGDASGRSTARRGFNDPKLWVAKTNRPEVFGFKVGNETVRNSYFLPIELLLLTPLHNWNPHNCPNVTDSYVRADDDPRANSEVGRTQDKPMRGYARRGLTFYHTPAEFYSSSSIDGLDPADTAAPDLWVMCGDGQARLHTPSGMPITLPNIPNVGVVRTRYPIYPVAEEGTKAFATAKAEELMNSLKRLDMATHHHFGELKILREMRV